MGVLHNMMSIKGKFGTWKKGNTLQIIFDSSGCKFKKQGTCNFCNYIGYNNITVNDVRQIFNYIKSSDLISGIKSIVLNTSGSIFSPDEISMDVLGEIIKYINNLNIKRVIFETHYTDVTENILKYIKDNIKDKSISIEMGMESCNQQILDNNLNKSVNISELQKTMQLIRSYDIDIELNILIGIPGLTRKQQVNDSLESIRWALNNEVSEVVLFPLNIKPHTPLYERYKLGKYNRINQWEVIEVLNNLTEQELNHISISWYGDRQDAGYFKNILAPIDCGKCHKSLMSFYNRFLITPSGYERRQLINKLIAEKTCEC